MKPSLLFLATITVLSNNALAEVKSQIIHLRMPLNQAQSATNILVHPGQKVFVSASGYSMKSYQWIASDGSTKVRCQAVYTPTGAKLASDFHHPLGAASPCDGLQDSGRLGAALSFSNSDRQSATLWMFDSQPVVQLDVFETAHLVLYINKAEDILSVRRNPSMTPLRQENSYDYEKLNVGQDFYDVDVIVTEISKN